MAILNLVNKEKSQVKYKISDFPDGQQQVQILSIDTSNTDKDVTIFARLNNFKDLELICCAVASLRGFGVKDIILYTPYFLGSRSDRKFENGSNHYLKDVICPIINNLKLTSVVSFDPHSDVLEACIDNFIPVSNYNLVEASIKDINSDNMIILSPDAGASKKIFKLASKLKENENLDYDIFICGKDRGVDGKINKTVVPEIDKTKDIVIIDDIIDGGYTFWSIAEILKKRGHEGKIYLIVSHPIFSKGFETINKFFEKIYTTDSYQFIGDVSGNDNTKTNVKQIINFFK